MLSSVLEMQKIAAAQLEEATASKIETTQEELDGFATVCRLLGPERPALFEDTASYFKIHLPERYTWVVCRLYFNRKRTSFWVPLVLERVQSLAPGASASTPQPGWTCVTMAGPGELDQFGEVLKEAWDAQRALRNKGADPMIVVEAESAGAAQAVADS
jgi:hypothetical protein